MVPLLLLWAAPMVEGEHRLSLPRLTPDCTLSRCHGGGKRSSPYRLTPSPVVPVDSKARAFANDGTYCAVVGDKYCTSKPRTLFRTAID